MKILKNSEGKILGSKNGKVYKAKEQQEPATALEHYRKYRPKEWPYIPLPSEMTETDDCIYLLYGKSESNFILPSFEVTRLNNTCTVYKYMNTHLVSSYDYQFGSSSRTSLQFTYEDEDWETYNYVIIKIQGKITSFGTTYSGYYNNTAVHRGSSKLLEANVKCAKCNVKFGTNTTATKNYDLRYISVKGNTEQTNFSNFLYECSKFIGFPEYDEISPVNAEYLFYKMTPKYLIPINSTNVTNLKYAYSETMLTNIDYPITNNVTTLEYCFHKANIKKFPEIFDTSNVSNFSNFISYCSNLDVTELNRIDLSSATNISNMLSYLPQMIKSPKLIFGKNSEITASYLYSNSSALEEIPDIDMRNIVGLQSAFSMCSNILKMNAKNICVSFSLSDSSLLSKEELVNILSNCQVVTASQKLTLGSKLLNKLTDVYVKETGVEEFEDTICRPCVICESTDEGAMLATDYFNSKGWTLA